jgi:hypothetical protein
MPVHERAEDSLMEVMARYERLGFKGQLMARAGGRILCGTCRKESDAGTVSLLALHRLEGTSDPGEEMAVVALECPVCDAKGTLVLAYGTSAPKEDALVLARLPDERGATGIRPGT